MILSSHIVAASVLTAPLWKRAWNFPWNFFAAAAVFLISLTSHYLLDLIPHWDYESKSFVKILDNEGAYHGERKFLPKFFYEDFGKMFFDGVLGLALLVFINGIPRTGAGFFLVGVSIFGAILPDLLQAAGAVFFKKTAPAVGFAPAAAAKIFQVEKSTHLQFHSVSKFFKENVFWGIVSQIFIIAAIVWLVKFLL